MKNVFGVLLAMSFALAGNSALAQSDLTCADIDFSYEITSRYPDAMNGCLDVVEVNGVSSATIDGFTITNGNQSGVSGNGGAIAISNCSPVITDCTISASTARVHELV